MDIKEARLACNTDKKYAYLDEYLNSEIYHHLVRDAREKTNANNTLKN